MDGRGWEEVGVVVVEEGRSLVRACTWGEGMEWIWEEGGMLSVLRSLDMDASRVCISEDSAT